MKSMKQSDGEKELEGEIRRISKLSGDKSAEIMSFQKSLFRLQKSPRRQKFLMEKIRLLDNAVGIIPMNEAKIVKAMDWVLSQGYENWTINGYKIALKSYWKFAVKEIIPADISDILKIKKEKNHKLQANDLVSPDELQAMIDHCVNERDKAMITLLYDSGLRHGEIIPLRIKDVKFDKEGAQIIVPSDGKTGTRMVRVPSNTKSYPFLRKWINEHPLSSDENAYLFCKLERLTLGNRIGYNDLNRIFYDILKRGNIGRHFDKKQGKWIIDKRIYPHLMRHTTATRLATKTPQRPLEMQMGWVPGTSMLATYAHLDVNMQDEAILKVYGIDKENDEIIKTDKPIRCPICDESNDSHVRFCWRCGSILSDQKMRVEKTIETLKESNIISEDAKDLLDESNILGLAKLLQKLEKSGKLDELIKLARKGEK